MIKADRGELDLPAHVNGAFQDRLQPLTLRDVSDPGLEGLVLVTLRRRCVDAISLTIDANDSGDVAGPRTFLQVEV